MTDRAVPATAAAPASRAPSFALVILATSMAFVVGQLDVTIVNVALPAMGRDLHAGVAALQWVVDAYAVAFAACMLSAGALGDRFGARRAFRGGMAVFALASIGCAAAPGAVALDAARAVQGLGAAIMLPNSLALLNHAFAGDAKARARGVADWTAAGAVSIALGPLLGGALVASVGWRAIFWVNVPLCVLGLWLSTRLADTPPHAHDAPADLAGQALATLALAALIAALIESRAAGGPATLAAGLAVAAAVLGLALWLVERRARAPVMAPDLFALPDFRGAVFFGMVANGTYYGAIFVIALFLQTTRHYGPMQAGLAFLPLTAGFIVSNVASGRVVARFGTRLPMIAGALVDLAGFGVLALAAPHAGYAVLAIGFLLIPLGMGLAVPAMTTSVLASVDKHRSALAAALLNTARQAAGALGVAGFGALVAGGAADIVGGLRIACVVSMAALAVAAVVAMRLKGVPASA